MAVPIPVEIETDPIPQGTKVTGINTLAPVIVELMSGSIDVSLIRGKVYGSEAPSVDLGPYLPKTDPETWYYWYDTAFGYQPGEQGCPVGTVAIAGDFSRIPAKWLLCDGSSVSKNVYPRLFNAIGYTWGGGGTAFNLPPGGCFFINSQDTYPPGTKGGAQTFLIPVSALPPLQIRVPYLNPQLVNANGPRIPNLQGPGYPGDSYTYPVTDEHGAVVGNNQQPIPAMPPFVLANFVIRYI